MTGDEKGIKNMNDRKPFRVNVGKRSRSSIKIVVRRKKLCFLMQE
jgi:hypothetical protein